MHVRDRDGAADGEAELEGEQLAAAAGGGFLLRSRMDPPWSLRIQDEAPLTAIAVVRGEAWLVPETGEPFVLRRGDVAIVRGPDPDTVADQPSTPPQAIIQPGQRCTTPDGQELKLMRDLGGARGATPPTARR